MAFRTLLRFTSLYESWMMNTRKFRGAVSSHLSQSLLKPTRRMAIRFDQFTGLPFAPFRPGAIAMLHVGRCGSTVLGNLLDQHPKVRWDGEIYFNEWWLNNLQFKSFDNRKFLKRRMWVSGRKYYGFELKFLPNQQLAIIQADLPEVISQFRDAGVTRFLILDRRNYLRMFMSWVVGRKKKQHHIPIG